MTVVFLIRNILKTQNHPEYSCKHFQCLYREDSFLLSPPNIFSSTTSPFPCPLLDPQPAPNSLLPFSWRSMSMGTGKLHEGLWMKLFRLSHHTSSVTATPFCHSVTATPFCGPKAALDSKYISKRGCLPMQLYLRTLKFEFHINFTGHELSFSFLFHLNHFKI